MIKTTAMLREEWRQYSNPDMKIQRMVKAGIYHPIIRGLYETDKTTPGYLLANSIYGPSYLSFDFALSYHGLIPEAVYNFTSATYGKNRRKTYHTGFGIFIYQNIPDQAYPPGVMLLQEQGYDFKIATPEKALCDKLYTLSPIPNRKILSETLIHDLRIEIDAISALNLSNLLELCSRYQTANHKLFSNWIRREFL